MPRGVDLFSEQLFGSDRQVADLFMRGTEDCVGNRRPRSRDSNLSVAAGPEQSSL